MSVSTDNQPVAAATPEADEPASHAVEPAHVPVERRSPLLGLAERYALVLLTAGICLYFSVSPKSGDIFASLSNVNVVLGGQTAVLMIAIAAVFPLVAGHIDFSLGATTAASMVLAAGLMSRHDMPLSVCVVACLAMGALVGLLNGVAVTVFGMNPFVTTLGVGTLLGGIILWYTGGQTIFQGISPDLRIFGSSKVAGLPQVTAVVAVVALVAWYVLSHTPYGRSLYAVGSNPVSARLVGLRVGRQVMLAFVIAGTIAGAAGVLQLSRTGSATADSGTALFFPALAAAFLGATAIRPGFFNVVGTVIGALFVSFSVSGLTLSGADAWVSPVFNGVALLIAVGLSTWLGARRRSRQ